MSEQSNSTHHHHHRRHQDSTTRFRNHQLKAAQRSKTYERMIFIAVSAIAIIVVLAVIWVYAND